MANSSSNIPPAFSCSPLLQVGMLVSIPLIAWAGMVSKLTTDWSTNPQYEFGVFVPVFILYLLGRRWGSRPDRSISRNVVLMTAIGLLIMLLLLPLRIVQEANPDWRPFNWFHAAIVVSFSLIPIAIVGGSAWVRHFFGPFLLIFSALPWPLATEQAVLQALSGAVTTVTVELLNLINIPALQRGNVIEIAAGSVGIADACSGIRSLAGTLMASLFFGEFYRLGTANRIALIGGGCLMSFFLNLCRAFFLSWRAAVEGIHSIEKWHDPAGFTIFAISFACLWFLATLMSQNKNENLPAVRTEINLSRFGFGWLSCGLLWMCAIYLGSDLWYKFRDGRRSPSVEWELRWPETGKSFQFVEVPSEARSILRYTSGKSAKFDWNDGSKWQVFFFRWAPGRSSVQLATMHRPEVCLPAIGYKLLDTIDSVSIPVSAINIPFSGSLFECDGNRVFVYRCLWEDFPVVGLARNQNFDMSISGRLLAAWHGRRNLGQRLLQIAIMGPSNEDEARAQLQQKLVDMIVLKG